VHRPTVTVRTRRLLRTVVLALFLIAFLGPWIDNRRPLAPLWEPRPEYRAENFFHFLADVLPAVSRMTGAKLLWRLLLLIAIVLLPLVCVAAILQPTSRLVVVVYRFLAISLAVLGVVAVAEGMSLFEPLWGPTLFLGAVLLASSFEFVPVPRPVSPDGDCANVVR